MTWEGSQPWDGHNHCEGLDGKALCGPGETPKPCAHWNVNCLDCWDVMIDRPELVRGEGKRTMGDGDE